MLKRLETYFEFTRLGTNWRTEILAGITTFLTMAYIVLVNPAILSASGVPIAAVTAAEHPIRHSENSAALHRIRRCGSNARRVLSWRQERLLGNADPAGQVGHGHQSAGKEKTDDGQDANQSNIPAVGLRP